MQDLAVVRYNADGTLDTSFDVDGKVIAPIALHRRGRAFLCEPLRHLR